MYVYSSHGFNKCYNIVVLIVSHFHWLNTVNNIFISKKHYEQYSLPVLLNFFNVILRMFK